MSCLFIELSHENDGRFKLKNTFDGYFSPGSKFIIDKLDELDNEIVKKFYNHLTKNDQYKINYVALLFIEQYEDIPKIFDYLGMPYDRKLRKNIFIIGGHGLHAPAPMEHFFDVIVCGDAEDIIQDIHLTLDQKKSKEEILIELDRKNIENVYIPEISENYPVKHFNYDLSINNPQQQFHDSVYFELNRGCKAKCNFCEFGWTHVFRQQKEEDIRRFLDTCDLRKINFMGGDTLGACSQKLQQKLADIGSYFSSRLDTLDEQYRYNHIRFGIEGISQWHRRLLGKSFITNEYLRTQIQKRSKNSSRYRFFMISNIIGTEESEIDHFYNFIRELKLEQRCYIEFAWTNLTPIPGTPLENYPVSEKCQDDKILMKYRNNVERMNDKIIITRVPATNYPSLRNTIFYRLDREGYKFILTLYKNKRLQKDFRKYPKWRILKQIVEHFGYSWNDLTMGGKILGWIPINPFEKNKEKAKRKVLDIMKERNIK